MSKKTAGKKMLTKKEILASKGLSAHAKEVLLNPMAQSRSTKTAGIPSARSAARFEDMKVDYADVGDDAGGGRSPNDDRSDSMNPNNDAYHAAMDNHANQMNPNNDAYWSSRGR